MVRGDRTLYVYALADPGVPARMRILGHALRTLELGRVAVIVEARDQRPPADTEVLQDQHAVVVRLAGRARALLPARFGSLMRETRLRALVAEHAATIATALARVRGRQQMTVRVFGTPDPPPPPVDPAAGGAAYMRARRARAQHCPAEVAVIRRALGSLVAAERVETGQRALRVTVFHLIPAAAVDAYRRRALGLESMLTPSRLTVSGPWPPFAFSPELFP